MDPQTNPNDNPSDEHVQLNKRSVTKLLAIVFGTILLALLFLAIFLPAFDFRRHDRRQMKNTTQVRGIVQGLLTGFGNNNEKLPGTNSKGYLIPDVDGPNEQYMPATKHGGTVEGRFWMMLDRNMFYGDYIISPAETKTVWTTGEVSSANYSYAMLNIHSDGGALASKTIRPDQTGRASEWKQSINTQAVLLADRARIPGGRIGNNYDKIYSIHTREQDAYWAGSVGRGDGSATFETEDTLDTQYGDGPEIEYDRLFARDQVSSRYSDKLTDPNAEWDDTANALLGYTSVGYEDPDIASE